MYEIQADLWKFGYHSDAVVITTNGTVKKDGSAVMGRGVAKQAAQIDPSLPKQLGTMIAVGGNHLYTIHEWKNHTALVTYPVKKDWWEPATIERIADSALELVGVADRHEWEEIVMPRPGCGAGGLSWKKVRPIIEVVLDDRFWVVWK